MSLFSGIMVYVLAWWIMLFCILPLDIQNIAKPTDGSMPGAPVNPGLKRKLLITTLLAAIVWCVIELVVLSDWISFRAIAARMSM